MSSLSTVQNIIKFTSLGFLGIICVILVFIFLFKNYNIFTSMIILLPYMIYFISILGTVFGNSESIIILIGLITNEFINTILTKLIGFLSAYSDSLRKLIGINLSNSDGLTLDNTCSYFYDIYNNGLKIAPSLFDRRIQTYSFLIAFLLNYFNKIYDGGESKFFSIFLILSFYLILIKLYLSRCGVNLFNLIIPATIGIIWGIYYYSYTISYINKEEQSDEKSKIVTIKDKKLKCKIKN